MFQPEGSDALGQLAEPVPLVIRNAPTSLMKDLKYGKGILLSGGAKAGKQVKGAAGAD